MITANHRLRPAIASIVETLESPDFATMVPRAVAPVLEANQQLKNQAADEPPLLHVTDSASAIPSNNIQQINRQILAQDRSVMFLNLKTLILLLILWEALRSQFASDVVLKPFGRLSSSFLDDGCRVNEAGLPPNFVCHLWTSYGDESSHFTPIPSSEDTKGPQSTGESSSNFITLVVATELVDSKPLSPEPLQQIASSKQSFDKDSLLGFKLVVLLLFFGICIILLCRLSEGFSDGRKNLAGMIVWIMASVLIRVITETLVGPKERTLGLAFAVLYPMTYFKRGTVPGFFQPKFENLIAIIKLSTLGMILEEIFSGTFPGQIFLKLLLTMLMVSSLTNTRPKLNVALTDERLLVAAGIATTLGIATDLLVDSVEAGTMALIASFIVTLALFIENEFANPMMSVPGVLLCGPVAYMIVNCTLEGRLVLFGAMVFVFTWIGNRYDINKDQRKMTIFGVMVSIYSWVRNRQDVTKDQRKKKYLIFFRFLIFCFLCQLLFFSLLIYLPSFFIWFYGLA